jgi:DNA-binding winged helix-turn-helix (wHTH) protein
MKVFDPFRLDTVNHSLWRGQERLSLAPKAFDVLRYLVEHAERLVTQEEILEALWPETYVNPEVVKKYVLGIRKVLGDQTSKPTFIATFPRRGYQFIAPLRDDTAFPISGTAPNEVNTIVGCEGALAELKGALAEALQGQRQIMFITGEAGIGKTTLVDAFHNIAACARTSASRAVNVWKASVEKKPTTRYWTLSDRCCETKMVVKSCRSFLNARPLGWCSSRIW